MSCRATPIGFILQRDRGLGSCFQAVRGALSLGLARFRSSAGLRGHELCSARPFSQGGFEYKRAIVDCIISIIEENSESKETGLSHLCEFIEDCEFTVLATRILHLLGQEGPKTNNPSKYIRFIYNRVVLEHEEVRAGRSELG